MAKRTIIVISRLVEFYPIDGDVLEGKMAQLRLLLHADRAADLRMAGDTVESEPEQGSEQRSDAEAVTPGKGRLRRDRAKQAKVAAREADEARKSAAKEADEAKAKDKAKDAEKANDAVEATKDGSDATKPPRKSTSSPMQMTLKRADKGKAS